jgi:uncharacterized protein YfaS (alpha-2-macroglobulin family)
LEIQREYLSIEGNTLDSVTLGEEFLVRLRLRATGNEYLNQIAVVDLLPGGVEPVISRPQASANTQGTQNDESAGEGEESEEGDSQENSAPANTSPLVAGFSGEPGQSTWHAEFADLRDDRLVIYGGLSQDMVTFTYRVRATNAGNYQTPAAYAEAMYKPTFFARSTASKFKIVKP